VTSTLPGPAVDGSKRLDDPDRELADLLDRSEDGNATYVRSIESLLGLLLEDVPFQELLEQVVDLTVRAVDVADAAAVTVERADGRTDTAAASDDASRHLDEIQRELEGGPCVDAMRSGEIFVVDDLRLDDRWAPRLRRAADEAGLASVLAIPMVAAGEVVGALNLFGRQPSAMDDEAVRTATGVAAPVAATLANARAYHRVEQLSQQLQEALDTRAVIEQAKGILMVRAGCDEHAAFAMLRRTSQHQNRKLRDVAAAVVAMRGDLRSAADGNGHADTDGHVARSRGAGSA
jgi:GAF domain-containing protein